MRSKFSQSRRSVPQLNVASMPDLIFTVLFFFMIVTHMRSDEVKVRLQVPQGKEVQKLANKQAVVNLYIGRQGEVWRVQLNNEIVQPADIPARIEDIRGGLSQENQQRLTVSLRVDKKAPMGLVSEVKRQLVGGRAETEIRGNDAVYDQEYFQLVGQHSNTAAGQQGGLNHEPITDTDSQHFSTDRRGRQHYRPRLHNQTVRL